jgi:uncharacterized protein YjbI with pentapeptide repeats
VSNKNFVGKCILGNSFKGSTLIDAKFNDCQFSIRNRWKVLHFIFWISTGAISGFTAVLSSFLLLFPFIFTSSYGASENYINLWMSLIASLSLVLFLVLVPSQGFSQAFSKAILVLLFPLLVGVILPGEASQVGVSFFLGIGALTLATLSLISFSILNFGLSITLNSTLSMFLSTILISIAVASLLSFLRLTPNLLFTIPIIFYYGNLALKRVSKEDKEFYWIHHLIIQLSTIGGSSFQDANLTDADFTGATLKHVNLRNADLTGTRWLGARGLDKIELENTYLANPRIRKLVVSCNGQGENFQGLDLSGVNLLDSKLQDASFLGSNLNHTNLRNANLSRAILKQTQLEGADLTGAILTGAYIEDWGITSTTKLKDVQCEYVYMRVPTQKNPNPLRKPDNLQQSFAEGEFADFIQPFFDTLDLYHSQDIDPRAISIALKNLSTNYPEDDLQFVAIERRGRNGINLRFSTKPGANKSELSHQYFAKYDQIKKELPVTLQIQLAEQNTEIRTLKRTIEQFIQTGTHHSTIRAETIQMIQGDSIMTEHKGININTGDNATISGLSSGDGIINLGTISGSVTNAINQLPDIPTSDQQPNLKTLLTQLQNFIQTDPDLSDPDKSDLLEQVEALAEAPQIEEPQMREGIVRKAMKMFDATLKSLPETAKIVEACSSLLPLILKSLTLLI